ncbi:MAG: UDP-N-acetylmuramate dehydrogenase [Bacteroidetes bacterium]|nr:UDP-N-acetylmuramate dehydrogenase [Bacteroidota bacterium]
MRNQNLKMRLENNISLKDFNTFGMEVSAAKFVAVEAVEDVREVIQLKEKNILILGGGSNILFTKNFEGLVIKNNLKGIEKIKETATHIWVKAMSGEVWHNLVLHCIENGFGGIENLSLIPGTVGAAPIQNIGAYGVEIKDVLEEVEVMNMESGELKTFNNTDCKFGYRDSIFKYQSKGKYFVISVTLKLSLNPEINISYGAITDVLKAKNIINPSIKDVSEAVCEIRLSKLPNPTEIGNAGSFFKNPEVEKSVYNELKKLNPTMPGYEVDSTKIKIPAGWLIEQCGWKGKRIGNTGSHAKQALVLVNYGGATGMEIQQLSKEIQESVFSKFGVRIEAEVNVL